MNNKNTVIGFILIGIVLIGFSWWNQRIASEREAENQKAKAAQMAKQKDSTANPEQMPTDSTAIARQDSIRKEAEKLFTFYEAKQEQKADSVVLRNDKVEIVIDTKGAALRSARLLQYKDNFRHKDVVTLFDGTDNTMAFELPVNARNEIVNTADLYFQKADVSARKATLRASGADGMAIAITYTLGDGYLLSMSVNTENMDALYGRGAQNMSIFWSSQFRQQEKGHSFENDRSTLTYHDTEGDTEKLAATGAVKEVPEESLDWVAFKTQFFAAVIIPKTQFEKGATLESHFMDKSKQYLKTYVAELKTPFKASEATEFEMYIGPNDFQELKSVDSQSAFGRDLELEDLVDLGWWLVRWINRWFTLYVFDGLTSLGLGMGIVLILITLLLKALTFPMVKKSYMSSAKMRVLKPKLEEATKQYDKPEDQMQKQQAMMQLYSQYGVSPLGGCLPMLIQMPIWIAMFFFVPNAIQLRGESFLWMDDLSTYDPIFQWQSDLPLIGDHLSLTCILFCVSNLLYSWLTMRQQRDQMIGQQAQQMQMMQWMMFLMPVMFFFIFNKYGSGLNFYYFVSLFFSAAIMWTLRKTTDDAKLLAKLEANYKENKNNPKKQSTLAKRLEAMQKQQAEMQRMREQMKKR